jgi:hypothetical protein
VKGKCFGQLGLVASLSWKTSISEATSAIHRVQVPMLMCVSIAPQPQPQEADADIGPKLYGMFLDASWRNVRVNVIQPTFSSGEGSNFTGVTLTNIAESVLEEKIGDGARVAVSYG